MSKAKLKNEILTPEQEAEIIAAKEIKYEKYLWKLARIGYRKYLKANEDLIKEKVTKIAKEARRKIRNREIFASGMMSMIVASFGLNIDWKPSVYSKNFNGLIMLGIIPENDPGRDNYYNGVVAYLSTAAVRTRLLISSTHWDAFIALIGGPRDPLGTPPGTNSTPGTWNYIYPLQSNKPTRTIPLTTAKKAIIKAINIAIHNMYADIPDNVIIQADTDALHIVPKADHQDPTAPEKITALAYPVVEDLGGGKIRVKTKKSSSAKRGSKLNDAVEIEFSYVLVDARTGVIPATVPAGATILTVSEANIVITLPDAALGMRIVLFARWIYVKHPDKSGGYGVSGNDIVT